MTLQKYEKIKKRAKKKKTDRDLYLHKKIFM